MILFFMVHIAQIDHKGYTTLPYSNSSRNKLLEVLEQVKLD